jgi:phosphatidylinositol alpha-1,6-mannosyltransferase
MISMLVTRNFPPLVGGMERVGLHLCKALASVGETTVVAPRGASAFSPEGVAVVAVPLKPLAAFLAASFARAVAVAISRRPHLIVAGSGLTAPTAWICARIAGGRSAVYLHGLDIVAPSRIYATAWLPFIRRCDLVICNSHNTAELARQHGVAVDRIHVLHPGTEMPAERSDGVGETFRRTRKLGTRPLLLSVGRFTRRKGLAEFVASALAPIVAASPDALLVIVGDEASDALHGGPGNERARIMAAAGAAGVAANLMFTGRLDEDELLGAYEAAACHVFPVLQVPGDVEGFGMVALESAAHGLPTVAFSVGGVPDAVAVPDSGTLIAAGDYSAFAEAVVGYLGRGQDEDLGRTARAFARNKCWPEFHARLRAIVGRHEAR